LTEISGDLGERSNQVGIPEWGNQSTLGSGVDCERSQGGPNKGKESTSSGEDDDLKEFFLATGSNGAATPNGLTTRVKASVGWEGSAPADVQSPLGTALGKVQDVLEEIRPCAGVDIVPILRSRPASPMVIPRVEEVTQTEEMFEISAPDREK
jgi:hypothetical protein